jgi:glycosyltransferase involved in cell wall biosynthesis
MDRPLRVKDTRPSKLFFIVNNAAFFVSHRLAIAQEAQRSGFEIELLTGQPGSDTLESAAERVLSSTGIYHHRVAFTSAGVNPIAESWGFIQLVWRLFRRSPDLVHCASPKAVLYGGVAARLAGVHGVVFSVSGLGYAFTATGRTSFLRSFVATIYGGLARLAYGHRNKRVIVQNLDDERTVVRAGLAKTAEVRLIPGSGVALSDLIDAVIENKRPIVLFPARMLADKGVVEFVDAARLLRGRAGTWRFILAGAADYRNPTSVSRQQIDAWQAEGVVEWLGHVEDMRPWYEQASIVCLPSYREGLPKALLEAAAAGCAIITTDAIGCREAIVPGRTGDLVPIRDSGALADALLSLIADRVRRERYGHAGRQLAIERFGIGAVVERTLEVYRELLADA